MPASGAVAYQSKGSTDAAGAADHKAQVALLQRAHRVPRSSARREKETQGECKAARSTTTIEEKGNWLPDSARGAMSVAEQA